MIAHEMTDFRRVQSSMVRNVSGGAGKKVLLIYYEYQSILLLIKMYVFLLDVESNKKKIRMVKR